MLDTHTIIALLGLILGWLGFLEKRLYHMKQDVLERVKEQNEVNKSIAAIIDGRIDRIEAKLDELIRLELTRAFRQSGAPNAQS